MQSFFLFCSHLFEDESAGYFASVVLLLMFCIASHGRIQRGDRGSRPPSPEKSQKYRVFFAILVRIPYHKAIKPEFNVGQFKWRFAGGPMMVYL